MIKKNIKDRLETSYKAFDRSKLKPDPLQFLHLYKDERDIEIMGLIASIFAYGNIKQIENSLIKIVNIFDGNPYLFIKNYFNNYNRFDLSPVQHRFYSSDDVKQLFKVLSKEINQYGSLKKIFLSGYDKRDKNIKKGLNNFSGHFLKSYNASFGKPTAGIKFMFPLPEKNSACKRMNLFLRWMVRKDELDFGIWKEIAANKLVIPVDTHIARICKNLKLTTLKNINWKMAEEITDNLKTFDANDPVKYDFAICHIGIRKMNL